MRCSVVLAVTSDDRPGIVERLSEVLASHGGNWLESNMMSLAGKFAGILLVDLPCREVEGLTKDMGALMAEGLKVSVEPCDTEVGSDGLEAFSLELVGQDRPGVIRDITHILAHHEVNVEELESETRDASMSGEQLFFARVKVQIPDKTNLAVLQDELEELANELMVDIKLTE